MNCSLLTQIFDKSIGKLDNNPNYVGQLNQKSACIVSNLKLHYLTMKDALNLHAHQKYQQSDSMFHNLLFHEELNSYKVKDDLFSHKHL